MNIVIECSQRLLVLYFKNWRTTSGRLLSEMDQEELKGLKFL